jgi:hypothetical protein
MGKTVHRPVGGSQTGAVKDKLKKAIASNLGYGQSAIRS